VTAMAVLLLQLAGPLQSWGGPGAQRQWSSKHTPTMSGVLGIVAAAQGRPRDADLSDLASLSFGVRVDRPGRMLEDYQTIHALPGHHIAQASGAEAKSGEGAILRKGYLADAVFLVGLQGQAALLQELRDALHRPRFSPYLGRRSCPPARPLCLGVVQGDLLEVLRTHPWIGAGPGHHRVPPHLLLEVSSAQGESREMDIPVSWDSNNRQFRYRSVHRELVPTPGAPADTEVDEHDPLQLWGLGS